MATDELKALDERPMNAFQVAAVAICVFLTMIDGFDVLAIAFTAPSRQRVGAHAAQIGALISWGLGGMTVGSLLMAPLADLLGRRLDAAVALAGHAGMLLAAFSGSYAELAACASSPGSASAACSRA